MIGVVLAVAVLAVAVHSAAAAVVGLWMMHRGDL